MECYDFSRLDPETLVTCPFDEVHRVSVKRLVRHLIKCSKVRCVVIGTRGRMEVTCSSYSSPYYTDLAVKYTLDSLKIKEDNFGPFAWFGGEGERAWRAVFWERG